MQANSFFRQQGGLYLVCDGEACAKAGIRPTDFIVGALAGGARIFQYRHKNISATEYAELLQPLAVLCAGAGALLIVNDHAAVAETLGLPLHLGQDDALPRQLSVPYGRSTHNFAELATALAATPQPAYLALGTMFVSPTKPDVPQARGLVVEYLVRTPLPLVLIGGITLENVKLLPRSERVFYAVIGDAFRFGATREGICEYAMKWRTTVV